MQTVLITGATSGIGKSTAELLAKKGYRLIICGRRVDRLKSLAKQLSALCDVYSLAFDVSNRKQVDKQLSALPDDWKQVDILINNAGNAYGLDLIHKGNIDDWNAMIDINVKGLLYISRAIIPQMTERQTGHIINIGSIAGKEVYTEGNVYCASKFAVDAISKAMRLDLNEYGIKITEINPGLIETEFSLVRFKGDVDRAKSVYNGMTPLSPNDIAEIIWFILSRPAHVNIAELLVVPTSQASAYKIHRNK